MLAHYYPDLYLVKGAELIVGDDVSARTANNCRVYQCDNGGISKGVNCTLLTTRSSGDTGVIIGGPTSITNDGAGFTWYQVQWNSDGLVGWSSENFLSRVVPSATAPTSLIPTPVGTNRIDLRWTDTSGYESTYYVERAPGTNGPWVALATLEADVTNYSDLNLYAASTWYYRVRAYNSVGFTAYCAITNATTAGDPPTVAPVSNRTIAPNTLLTITNVGSSSDRVRLITDFEPFLSETANGIVMFRDPLCATNTTNFLSKAPEVDLTTVTDTYPTGGMASGKVLMTHFLVTNTSNPWLRLTTLNASNYPNPVIDFTKKLRFDVYSDQTIKLAVGCRETTNAAGTAIGFNGGTNGAIEWAGVTNVAGTAPMATRVLPANTWTNLVFNFPSEPIRNFSGGNGVLSTTSGLGVLEHLAIVPTAGSNIYNVYLDNFAVLNPRTLTYSLGAGAPSGSSVNSASGVFSWTPTSGQAPSTNVISVIASDDSVPALKATNTFTVFVSDGSIVITNQPQSVTTNVGANLTFTVGASGTSLKYQWLFNATNVLSAKTNASLTLSNVQITNIGSYSVVVSNTLFSVTSSNAVLSVLAPIIVSSAPESRTNNIGDNAFFGVTATGTNLTYQWQFNGGNLSGQTTSAINITVNDVTNAGTYSVILSSPYATNLTNSAVLSVPYGDLLKIVQWNFNSPTADANVTTGTNAPSTGVGTVTVIGGANSRFAAGSSTDVASLGTDNSSWAITNYAVTNIGNKTHGIQVNVSTLGYQNLVVTWEQYNDAQSSRYSRLQYTTNGTDWIDGDVIVNTNFGKFVFQSSDLSEVLDVNANTNFAVRIVTEFQSTATGSGLAAYVPADPAGSYSTNAVIRYDMLTVLALVGPPVITAQPQSQTLPTGSSAVFTVAAVGVDLAYQWQKDGVDLSNGGNVSGVTTTGLTVNNVAATDAGNYTVVVTSGGGAYTQDSDPALLTVVSGTRYWSANGSSYGGSGTWNTTSNQWALSSGGPFNLTWNNGNGDMAVFGGTAGTNTIGEPITVNQLIFQIALYGLQGTNAITFTGVDSGISNPGALSSSTTNVMTVSCPLAGPLLVKTGGGRLNCNNTGNSVNEWVVKDGMITSTTGNNANVLFGSAPAALDPDFITLDGGALGFGASAAMTVGANRGIYLGTNGGRIGNNGTGGIVTIDGPISGPGELSFPGTTEFPGQIHGDNCIFILSNTNNCWTGVTRIKTAEIRMGTNQVFPTGTSLIISNLSINGRLNLNGYTQKVATVVLDSAGNSRIFDTNGTGSLSADLFDLRGSAYASGPSVSAVLAGTGTLTKTTAGNIYLGAANTYTGATVVSAGTLTIDAVGRFGSGAGTLNLAGGSIVLNTNRPTANALLNPLLLTANSSINNGDTTANPTQLPYGGTLSGTSGTLTIRNTTSTGAGSFDVLLTNGFNFAQPIIIGIAGDKPTQLTSFSPLGAADQIFSGQISGVGTFRRSVSSSSGGRTVFAADNTYSGVTTVDGGILVVNNPGPGSGTGTNTVTVSAGGVLYGSGKIAGNVVVSGTISAGNGVGILTLQNGLNLSSSGTNTWELANLQDDASGGIPGTDYDQLLLTGGQLQLGGTSKLQLSFNGSTTPNDFDQFWRANHAWKIVSLTGASNLGNAAFASIVNGTYSCGTFTNQVDGSGNIILRFTTSISSSLWWSANGSTLGGTGTWDVTNTRWGATNAPPFSLIWNNSLTNTATFGGTGGTVTIGANVTVNQIIIVSSNYTIQGSSTATFAGDGAGVDVPGVNNGDATNNLTIKVPVAGSVLTKTGGGRLNLNNTANSVGLWVVKNGTIGTGNVTSNPANGIFGTGNPASLVTNFLTLDTGGLSFTALGVPSSFSIGATRGIYLGSGGGKIGASNASVVITIDGPISGPGDLSFPDPSEWPAGEAGSDTTFVLSSTNNSWGGATRIKTTEVRAGTNQVFPLGTTIILGGTSLNGRLNLNGKTQTVAAVTLDSTGTNSRIFDTVGTGSLIANIFDLRGSGYTAGSSVSAILAGNGTLTKTTTGNVSLGAANTYTGDTTVSAGTLTIDAVGRFGSGVGKLNLSGGAIVLSTNRVLANAILNPLLLTANSSINNGDATANVTQLPYGGTLSGTAGTLTLRNTTSTGAGSFELLLTNGFSFTQPIVIGNAGDKATQLTGYSLLNAPDQIFSGQISGIGSFRRSVSGGAGGRTVFATNNTYSGVTTVDGGSLVVNNPGPSSGTGTNTVTVNTNGMLAGSGFIGGNVIVNGGGVISAGDTLGALTLQNGLTLTNAGTNIWDLAANVDNSNGVAGVDFDQLVLTGGYLRLGGSSKLLIRFSGTATSPDILDPFWRTNHSWTIVRLNAGQNTNNASFATIINPTNAAGYFSTTLSSGSVVLNFTSSSTNDLFWSGDASALGGSGTWNITSNNWAKSSAGPFNQAWNNSNGKNAIFDGVAGSVTNSVAITVKQIIAGTSAYYLEGTNTITFAGTGNGADYKIVDVGDTNRLTFDCPIAGTNFTKTGAGRIHLTSTNNSVSKWCINGGIISVAAVGRFGSAPPTLVADFIKIDGGGIGFDGTAPDLDSTRGVTLGTTAGNKMGVRSSSVTLTLDAPLTGPGGITFPGYASFPSQIHGGAGTFVFNNTNNNYLGETTVVVGTLKLGTNGVIPNTTTLTISNSAKVDLNGFNETVNTVVLNGSNARVIGSGVLTASSYDVRRSGDVSAVLGGTATLTKSTTNIATLSGTNTYSGGTVVNAGTLLINNANASGTGTGTVQVNSSGTIAGTGLISGNVVVNSGGNISGGSALGKLRLQNGLNLSSGGTDVWNLYSLADDTSGVAGTNFDQLQITGGNLVLNGSSQVSIQFAGTATNPDFGDSYWQTNHSWTIVSLAGGLNPGNSQFVSIVNGTFNTGSFSVSLSSGSIVLNYTQGGGAGPHGLSLGTTVIDSGPVIMSVTSVSSSEAVISWTSVSGKLYELQSKTDLGSHDWKTVSEVVGTGAVTSVTINASAGELQKFYRVLPK